MLKRIFISIKLEGDLGAAMFRSYLKSLETLLKTATKQIDSFLFGVDLHVEGLSINQLMNVCLKKIYLSVFKNKDSIMEGSLYCWGKTSHD